MCRSQDPARALKGALRTFDRGYKSSNLALMVELLAGPLVGAAHVNKLAAKNWGNLVVAINPGMLGEPAKFYKAAGEVIERVRTAERLPGVDERRRVETSFSPPSSVPSSVLLCLHGGGASSFT